MEWRETLRRWFTTRNQFEAVPKLEMRSTFADAVSLYGAPHESEEKEMPELQTHGFLLRGKVDVTVQVWRDQVHQISFWAREWQDPMEDLEHILDAYQGDSEWNEVNEGYVYRRADGALYLNCSGMPVIGVKTIEFAEATAAYNQEKQADD